MKIEESLNVTFDETPPPSKTSPLVDDDLDDEEEIKVTEKKNLENDIEDETLKIDVVVNIKESRNHPLENVIGNLNQRTLRSQAQNQSNFFCFISTIEPKNVNEALKDESWIIAMQEELNQFIANIVWELVPKPKNMTIIGTKWVYRNKLDENGVISRNKASAFLNGFINEEVYVAQPTGFIDFEKLDHVYKLKKDLYVLKQEPKAWYDRLKAFIIKHEYKMGMVDNTLFTKKKSSNLIIVQIYVDDIIFDSTWQDMCDDFAKIMHDEFKMIMMGELNFFLGLQIKQMEDGIFFNQSKYINEILKKFGLEDSKPMKTPMSSDAKLAKEEECESVHSTKYQGILGCLLYLTASRSDIMFSVCLCARFQEDPKTSHLEVKQTALTISTTEAEYVSAEKACQQALWMKQALIDYEIRLDDVSIMCPTGGPYQTNHPCPDEIKNYVQEEREGPTTRIHHDKVIAVEDNQILTLEIVTVMKSRVKIIRENVFCLGGKRDHVPAYLCHMLYCIASPELSNDHYIVCDCVMYPLTAQQERKTRKDYGTRRGHSYTSSSSAFGQPSSSYPNDDDNDGNDKGTSHASTPSPTRFVNSLSNDIP
ncbi:retrovirus-related pol polyprotein from transposon TNT 1-94 [Tanacetum coccineum]